MGACVAVSTGWEVHTVGPARPTWAFWDSHGAVPRLWDDVYAPAGTGLTDVSPRLGGKTVHRSVHWWGHVSHWGRHCSRHHDSGEDSWPERVMYKH